uniref:DSCR3 protein n=1 Tax=Schistocephalus solidus TaxID=70667 RepID=A0A183TKR4_SCHSO
LGDDEVLICPTIGITNRLGYQHVLSISPPDENIVQQMSAPRPRVHPRGLLPHRKAEEGVGQQETVFRTRAQKKEAVIVTATETVETQHSLPGSFVCPDAGFEVTKDN